MWQKYKKFIIIGAAILVIVIAIIVLSLIGKKKTTQTAQPTTSTTTTPSTQGLTPNGQPPAAPTSTSTGTNIANSNADETPVPAANPTDKLIALTPIFTTDFAVEYNKKDQSFTISLYAVINHDWQLEQYKTQLKQFKDEALAWITLQGVDPTTIKINYIPEEAKDL